MWNMSNNLRDLCVRPFFTELENLLKKVSFYEELFQHFQVSNVGSNSAID